MRGTGCGTNLHRLREDDRAREGPLRPPRRRGHVDARALRARDGRALHLRALRAAGEAGAGAGPHPLSSSSHLLFSYYAEGLYGGLYVRPYNKILSLIAQSPSLIVQNIEGTAFKEQQPHLPLDKAGLDEGIPSLFLPHSCLYVE